MPLKRAVLLALVLSSCATRRAPAGQRQVTDGTGRILSLGNVHRVVSLAPSSTEILFALGAGERIVGLDRYSDWPPETKRIDHVGDDIAPSLERIVAMKPDVVFTATSANSESTTASLERLGVPVFVSRVSTLEDVYRDIQQIGLAVDRAGEAARLVGVMRARIAAVSGRVRGEPPVPAAVIVWSEPLTIAGNRSHVAELLAAAGGTNIADDTPQPFPTYSLERLVERAPRVLVVGSHSDVTPPMAPLEALTSVPAVRDHRIVPLDGDLLFRPGPRLPDGVEALGRALHPDRFADGGVK
jgi:iron complex transport system substrate-binding protein